MTSYSAYERSKQKAQSMEAVDDAAFWTTDMVIGYVRRSLLEEGVDTRAISDLCEALEEQSIDGRDLLNLDEQKIRYDIGVGALSVRRKFMEVIDNLRPAVDPRAASESVRPSHRDDAQSMGSVTEDEEYEDFDTRTRDHRGRRSAGG